MLKKEVNKASFFFSPPFLSIKVSFGDLIQGFKKEKLSACRVAEYGGLCVGMGLRKRFKVLGKGGERLWVVIVKSWW